MLTLWAGDLGFFSLQLQHKIDAFVWEGRSRVCRNTSTQSKANGGLGLIMIYEQYRVIAGNLIIWVLGPEPHPLRSILRSHIHDLSFRKWGISDYTLRIQRLGGLAEYMYSLGSTKTSPGNGYPMQFGDVGYSPLVATTPAPSHTEPG